MKLPLVDPEATVTLLGTAKLVALLDRPTTNPAAGAGLVRLTEQERVPEPVIVVGLHDTPESCEGIVNSMDAVCWTPFAEAVTTAVTGVDTALVRAVNDDVVELYATVEPAGT